jgi:hypothetical protein
MLKLVQFQQTLLETLSIRLFVVAGYLGCVSMSQVGQRIQSPNHARYGSSANYRPGKEWTKAIELKDITRKELEKTFPKSQILHEFHLYRYHLLIRRFDQQLKEHVLDTIALIKTFRFPKTLKPFELPEPQPAMFRNLLLYRMEHEKWQDMRSRHSQSDFSQYQMLVEKLSVCDSQVTGNYRSLKTTMENMTKMITNLVTIFDPIELAEVKKLVKSIPEHIKKIVQDLERDSGIIIKDSEKIKLSPLFVENMVAELKTPPASARTSRSSRTKQPGTPTISPEIVEELLNGFVNNSISARKRENQDDFAKRRRTWKC